MKTYNSKPVPASIVKDLLRSRLGEPGGEGIVWSTKYSNVVCKWYNQPRGHSDLAALQELIDYAGNNLRTDDRLGSIILDRVNLPTRPVVDSKGRLRGVILKKMPQECFVKSTLSEKILTRTGDFIAQENSPAGFFGESSRWVFAYYICEVVTALHSLGLVHGDLSSSNVIGLKSENIYKAYLIDCDGLTVENSHAESAKPKNTPWYFDPYAQGQKSVTRSIDVYLIALWLVNLLEKRKVRVATRAGIPTLAGKAIMSRSPELHTLVERALGPPETRPLARDLYKALHPVVSEILANG